jgi:double zinc ribbon protein/PEGA domain-containing protein
MICSNCRSEIAAGKLFCGRCGTAIRGALTASSAVEPSTIVCLKCGRAVSLGKKFCGGCGSLITNKPSQTKFSGQPPQSSAPTLPTSGLATERPDSARPKIASGISQQSRNPVSVKLFAFVGAPLVVIVAAVTWFAWGVELDIVSKPSDARVMLDGRPLGNTDPRTGTLSVPHVARGKHTLSLTYPGFDTRSQPVSVGWFALAQPLDITLSLPSFPLSVTTDPPGAKIEIDGQAAGVSDASGSLIVPQVPLGRHTVTVSLDGYASRSSPLWVKGPASIKINLGSAPVLQTGADPTTGEQNKTSGNPRIISISTVLPQADQTIEVTGQGLGNQPAFSGNSRYILFTDLTQNWNAGNAVGNDLVTLKIMLWSDTKVIIGGLTGAYGSRWRLSPGDQVRIQIWNPQSGSGPATGNTTVMVQKPPQSGDASSIPYSSKGPQVIQGAVDQIGTATLAGKDVFTLYIVPPNFKPGDQLPVFATDRATAFRCSLGDVVRITYQDVPSEAKSLGITGFITNLVMIKPAH